MTDVMELAKRQRARLADEVAKLDAFLFTARTLAETGRGLAADPEVPDLETDAGDDDATVLSEMLRKNGPACSALAGRMIRHRRWMLGITVEDLGRLAGLDPGAIADYERGRRPVTAGVLRAIAAATRVPVSFFLREPGAAEISGAQLVDGLTGKG